MLYIVCSAASKGISMFVSGVAVMALIQLIERLFPWLGEMLNMPDDFHRS
jgi:hypothetical protein